MKLPFDILSENYRKPKVILCQTNKDKICPLDAIELTGTFKFNSYSEISFNVASTYYDLITGEKKRTPYYDYIEGLRLVYLEGFGYFQLQNPELYSDGIQEYKQINAYSLEYSLSQRYLETFIINMGDTGDSIGSIDGVVLYNPLDVEHSLLHLVLKKAYGWTVGHVDEELKNQSRSFEVDRESIYDFIMNDMCDTFKCYVEFDTINNTINVYSENEIERFIGDGETHTFKLLNGISKTTTVAINGHEITQYKYDKDTKELTFIVTPAQGDIVEVTDEFKHKYDTDIIVTFENLSNEMKVNYSADDIKTVLTVKGADDLDVRNVNFGLPSIMNLDYYCTPEWMGDKLYNEYKAYVDKQDKYMSGFYSRDISGSSEETFEVVSATKSFNVGNVQEFIANGTQESFNVNGDKSTFNIDKILAEFENESEIEEFNVDGNMDTFKEPEVQSEEIQCADPSCEDIIVENEEENTFNITSTITDMSRITLNDKELKLSDYQYSNKVLTIKVALTIGDVIKIYTYQNIFKLTNPMSAKSVVYINGTEINDYVYDNETKELTLNERTSSKDIIKISTPLGEIVTSFQLSNIANKIAYVKVDGTNTNEYSISNDKKVLIITDKTILQYGSTITIEYFDNHFVLNALKDQIVCVKINNIKTSSYSIDDTILTITAPNLSIGDTVSVESIDTHFDLSQHKDKVIVSVSVDSVEISSNNYMFDADGILTIDYNIKSGDKLIVKLVNNNFIVSQKKDEVLSVSIDSEKIPNSNYVFDNNSNTLTITALDLLFNGEQVTLESCDNYFILTQLKDIISSVIVDGRRINDDKFSYTNNRLHIEPDCLTSNSNITVISVDNHFYLTSLDGEINSISVDKVDLTEGEYAIHSNLLTINSKSLKPNSVVSIKTINNKFYLPDIQNNSYMSVMINGNKTENYTFAADVLVVSDKLRTDDVVSIELIDNHFTVMNEVGARRVIELSTDGLSFEQIQEGKDGYDYDSETKTLTINVALKNGDKIKVINVDSTDALLIVSENAKDGEILIGDVTPTLKSYIPKIGEYVVKINGYTDILKELYQLIDERLTEENSVPDEYKITEKIVTPENFNEQNLYLPEANIENLGEVYKIINQDSKGNDVAYKYYVCEMKMSTYTDDDGKQQQKYEYVWKERDMVFGGEGINSLKEKIDIYSAINDIQIAAEWDKKPEGSDEKESYTHNWNNLQKFKKELEEKQQAVDNIELKIQYTKNKIQLISDDVNVNKNFSPESLDRLSLFLREDEYSDDCFCITDIDTDLDIINTQKELLVAGYKKLKSISRPTLSFTASMKNIYAIPEFAPILHQFKLGNFIKVRIREDFLKKARLLEVQLDFDDLSNFSCTFGDLLSAKDQGDIHADLLAQAVNAGKAVASGSSYWQKGYDVATAIAEKIKQGLIDATTSIKSNSAGQDVSWDNYGIHLRKVVDGVLDPHEGWITNNKFLYSDDNFKTTQSLFGNYTINNETYWGVLAGCVSAGLIEGSKIIGGEICIGEREDGTYNFKVDKDGTVTMNKGDAAEKLSYFSFDGDNGLVVGENKDGEYFSRVSAQKIEFCRKARILTVTSEPSHKYDNYDYILYKHTEGDNTYYDYYKNPDFIYRQKEPAYDERSINEDFPDAEIKFGITITYFANNTAYMKQAEVEGNLKVGTEEKTPYISLGNYKIQIESNGSLSILAT